MSAVTQKLATVDPEEGDDGVDLGEQMSSGRGARSRGGSEAGPRRGSGTNGTGVTRAAWTRHEEEKRVARLDEDEREAHGDRLLAEHGHGGHHLRSRRTTSRHRAREIPMSQLEAPGYSGTRHLLRSMAEGLRLVDFEEHGGLSEWFVQWEAVHAIRAETGLTLLEKEALIGRIRGETLRESAGRLEVSHEKARTVLATALAKYYAGKLRRLEAASAAAACFYEDVSRWTYRPPNCCGQSPLCLDDADKKPCAQYAHDGPKGMKDDEVRPGDRNYCPLAELPRWLRGRR